MRLIKHYFSVWIFYVRLSILKQLEYPLFLVAWILLVPFHWITGVWLIKIIVEKFNSLNGWDFSQLTFVYGLGLLSHGIVVIFFIQTLHVENLVVRGEFDRMLLRPMNVFFQFISANFNFIGFLDVIPGVIIFIYACNQVDFIWTISNILNVIIVLISGTLIRTAIYMIIGSIAFWTKRIGSLVNFTNTLLTQTTTYPLTIYPHLIQIILTFIIPIGFVSFYPSIKLLNKEGSFLIGGDLTFWTLGIGLITFFVAQSIFKLGLKNYESSGT